MAIIGPGAVQQSEIQPDPILNDATDYEYVTILNPFTDDFKIQVAQDVPVNLPLKLRNPTATVQNERDVAAQYGIPLKNADHQGKQYIYNTAIIPAGGTMNFKGSEAQVVVRQVVNELLQREGKKRMMADPTTRREAEERVVIRRGTVQDIMDKQLISPTQQINDAVNKSNEVQDAPFPGLERTIEDNGARSGDVGDTDSAPAKRAPGRPAKV